MKNKGSVFRRGASKLRAAIGRSGRRSASAGGETCGYSAPQTQSGAQWSWRPEVFCSALRIADHSGVPDQYQLCDGLKLFHNSPDPSGQNIALRHVENSHTEHGAPYGVSIAAADFDGEFVSMAIDLPSRAFDGLTRDHLIKADIKASSDTPVHGCLRLNIINGPNTEQISNMFTISDQTITIEMDMAYTQVNQNRIERGWIDVIFNTPLGSELRVHDLTMCTVLRAEF